MKKRRLALLALAGLAACFAAAGFSACAHAHDWRWQADEYGHKTVCAGCGEERDAGVHTFDTQNKCAVCGYELQFTENMVYEEILDGENATSYAVNGFAEGCENDEKIVVPNYYNGLPVTEIAYAAFYAEAESPNETLKTVVLPSSVKTIGDNAFNHCSKLESVNLDSVTAIGKSAFWDTALTEVTLPAGLLSIGDYAFYECHALEKVTVNGAAEIGDYIFWDCTALSDVTVNADGFAFNESSFYGCTEGSIALTFGGNVTRIGEGEQYGSGNEVLRTLTIGEGVKTIGQNAFSWASNLESVSFPKSLEAIDEGAFHRCNAVQRVDYAGSVAEWSQIDFAGGDSNPLACGASLWIGDTKVTEIIIDGVETVKRDTFYGIDAERVTLSESVKTVGQYAFFESGIKELVLAEGVEEIQMRAFDSCAALETVSIPKSLVSFEQNIFQRCDAVKRVNYAGSVVEWSQIDFVNGRSNPLQCGGASLWIDGAEVTEIVIDDVETVKQNAFYGLNVESVTLGESVTGVEGNAFQMPNVNAPLSRLTLLGKNIKTITGSFGNRLSAETEIFYKGTAAEMAENVIYDAGNVHWFTNCVHYFYSENPADEETVTTNRYWTFGGFWHFAADGKTIEKWETE